MFFFTFSSLSSSPAKVALLNDVPISAALLPIAPGHEQSCNTRGGTPTEENLTYTKKTYKKSGCRPSSLIPMNPCVLDHNIKSLREG